MRNTRPAASAPAPVQGGTATALAARLLTVALLSIGADLGAAAVAAAPATAAAAVTHWEWSGWGGGGFFWSCVWSPTDRRVLYLGGDVAGAYRSADQGASWQFINRGLHNYAVHALAVAPSNPDVVYAMTLDGICRSADGGQAWAVLEQTRNHKLGISAQRPGSVRAVAVDPANADLVYAGSRSGGLFRSSDGGTTWQKLDYLASLRAAPVPALPAAASGAGFAVLAVEEKGVISAVAVGPLDPRLVFTANTELGLFRSRTAGETWARLETPRSAAAVAVSPCVPGLVYAACAEEGAWRSEDGGDTWAPAKEGLVAGCAVREVVPDPRDPAVVYCIANLDWKGFFYRSEDQGRHWQGFRMLRRDLQANPTLPDETGSGQFPAEMADLSRLTNLAVCPTDPKLLFLAGNWRNAVSVDGGRTWTESSRGADISCVQDIRFHGGKVYVTAMDEGLLTSADRGATWQQLTPRRYREGLSGHQWRVRVWTQDGRASILATASPWAGKQEYPNTVLLSTDGGATFRCATAGLPTYVPKVNTLWGQGYARALDQDPTDPRVLYLGIDGDPEPDQGRAGGGVFRSRDAGATWQPLPAQPASRRGFFGLAVDPTDPRRLFWGACGNNGGIHRTADGGESWQRVFGNESWVFNLLVAADGTVYAGGRDLWRSADHGTTWHKLTAFADADPVIVGLEIDPQDPNRLWLSRVTWGDGARGGVFHSGDGGKTWQDITADLPYCKPLILRYDPASRDLWAGGVGLFRTRQ